MDPSEYDREVRSSAPRRAGARLRDRIRGDSGVAETQIRGGGALPANSAVARRQEARRRGHARYPAKDARGRSMNLADRWFASKGWTPFAFQREVWDAYLAGESGLIHAATGTGKTLAAWFGAILEGKGRILCITPRRALVADTLAALSEPVADLGLGWSIEARTGDTDSATRARQVKRLPTALVTTPESLSMLLSRPDSATALGTLRAVIVDEWHELMGSKRGVLVELALARIRAMVPDVRIWGLSATIGNLDTALDALLGGAPGRIVRGVEPKQVV